MSNKPNNAFIHRLIPVATAAGLTFSACVIPETEPTVVNNSQIDSNAASNNATSNNMTSGNNTTSANNTAANNTAVNNTAANSTTPANNTGINSTTPANNTSVNNTSPANNTSVNNTTPANNTSANNTSPVNNTTPANNTSPGTEDGQLSDDEISAFCQAFYDCDATLFAESYDSVESCKQETRTYVDETLTSIEQNYSAGCAMAYEAFYEGYLNAGMCAGGSFTIDEARLSEIEAAFDAAYDMYCLN